MTQEKETKQQKPPKRKFKVPYARKYEKEKIPFEKDSLSSSRDGMYNGTEKYYVGKVRWWMKKSCALIILHILIQLI